MTVQDRFWASVGVFIIAGCLSVLVFAPFMVPLRAQTALGGPIVVCNAINQTTATLIAFTQPGCFGRQTQEALYITDITASASIISTITADQFLELKSGTGTNCATGTVVIWAAYSLAFAPIHATFKTPLKVAGGQDLCWMHAAAGNKSFVVTGYLGNQ